MNSFRLFGPNYWYVSKSGVDATGTTGGPDDPFRTLGYAIAQAENSGNNNLTIVMGTGLYEESITINLYNTTVNLLGDGDVTLTGLGTGGSIFHTSVAPTISMSNINIDFAGNLYSGSGSGMIFHLSDCIVSGTTVIFAGVCAFSGVVFRNSVLRSITSSSGSAIQKCTFINSVVGDAGLQQGFDQIVDSFFDANSRFIRMNAPTIGNWDHCCFDFQGGSGTQLTFQGDVNTYTDLASLQAAYPQFNQNSLDSAPAFNSGIPGDYTLQSNSPLAYAASDGSHIGAWGMAISHGVAGGDAFEDITGVNQGGLQQTGQGWQLQTGNSTGTLLSLPIDLQSVQTVGKIRLFANMFPPGDVIDHLDSPDNPNKYTYRLRWANSAGSLSTADWADMEWNTIPTINTTTGPPPFIGNGDPGFDPNQAQYILAQWIQLEVTLRNNGTAG